jgi:4-amino-4-deoxy-L-arabinose transferase-like glycosyltransferase
MSILQANSRSTTTDRANYNELGMMRRWRATLIFIFAFALYFFTRGLELDEWDAVQFAMGTRHFDLWHHQPQPPGYPLFIFCGWAVQRLFHGDPEFSLHLISCFGGAVFVACWFSIVRMQFNEASAWLLAGTLAITPIVWMTATRAMTDAPAVGLLSAELLWALRYRQSGRQLGLIFAALLGATATGIRPQFILIVIIILATHLRQRRASAKIWLTGFGLLFCGCLVWLLPTWYLQWKLRPEFPPLQVYPKLVWEQWTWRLDKPLTYIGAGDWSFSYLKERFASHILGWFNLGLGLSASVWTLVIGSLLAVAGITIYLCRFSDSDRQVWKTNWIWASAHVLIVFCSLPWEQRYYLPIFPLLLLAILFGFFRLQKYWRFIALALPALLFWISLPLAIANHTEEAPPVRFVRFLQDRHPPAERKNVLLIVGESKRHVEWYAPDFPLFYVSSLAEVEIDALIQARAIYTDNASLELAQNWRLIMLGRFTRSILISPKHSEIDVYRVERFEPDL